MKFFCFFFFKKRKRFFFEKKKQKTFAGWEGLGSTGADDGGGGLNRGRSQFIQGLWSHLGRRNGLGSADQGGEA